MKSNERPFVDAAEGRILLGLVGLGIVIRSIAALRTAVIFNDGLRFIHIAELIEQGEWMAALADSYHPLYSILLWIVHFLIEDWETAGIVVSVLCGSIAVVPLYAFVRAAFDRRTAWIAAFLLSVHPYAVVFSADVQSEGLYLLLFISSVAVLWSSLEGERAWGFAAAGALAGLAYLTRPEGIGVAVVGAVALGGAVALKRFRWGAALRCGVGLVLGFLIVSSPYLLTLRTLGGEWALTQKKSMSQIATGNAIETEAVTPTRRALAKSAFENTSAGDLSNAADGAGSTPPSRDLCEVPLVRERLPSEEGARSEEAWSRGLGAIREVFVNLLGALRPEVLLLIAAGLWSLRGRPTRRAMFIGAFAALYGLVLYGLALNVGYLSRRHILPPVVPLLAYAAVGVPLVGEQLARVWRRLRPGDADPRSRRAIAIALGLAFVLCFALPKALASHRSQRLAERRAAEWLAQQGTGRTTIAAESYRAAYYAEAGYVSAREGARPRTIAELARRGARFAVVDEAELTDAGALSAQCARDLVRVHVEEAEGQRVVVFELGAAPLPRD